MSTLYNKVINYVNKVYDRWHVHRLFVYFNIVFSVLDEKTIIDRIGFLLPVLQLFSFKSKTLSISLG